MEQEEKEEIQSPVTTLYINRRHILTKSMHILTNRRELLFLTISKPLTNGCESDS